jgi:hypothetical protein
MFCFDAETRLELARERAEQLKRDFRRGREAAERRVTGRRQAEVLSTLAQRVRARRFARVA